MKKQKNRLTKKANVLYNTDGRKKMPKKLQNHPVHTMRKKSTTVEEITVYGSSITKKQSRIAIHFACICKEEDVFYRQADDMVVKEYSKPAKK